MNDYPFPHGFIFGGIARSTGLEWNGIYEFQPYSETKWKFTYLDENDQDVPELSAYGKTPFIAFSGVLMKFVSLNHNILSPTLEELLPTLVSSFNDEGYFKAAKVFEV